jgi:hypothetical protein
MYARTGCLHQRSVIPCNHTLIGISNFGAFTLGFYSEFHGAGSHGKHETKLSNAKSRICVFEDDLPRAFPNVVFSSVLDIRAKQFVTQTALKGGVTCLRKLLSSESTIIRNGTTELL